MAYIASLLSIISLSLSSNSSWIKHYEYDGIPFGIDSKRQVVHTEHDPQKLQRFQLNLAIMNYLYPKPERQAFNQRLRTYNAKRMLEKNPCLNQYRKKAEFLKYSEQIATEIVNANNVARLTALAITPRYDIKQLESIHQFVSDPKKNKTNTPAETRQLIESYLMMYLVHSDKKVALRLNQALAENIDFFTKLREPYFNRTFPDFESVCPTID